ncbi:hypothetical protein [Kitasatospora purpeofusca]|uniref:hypothetical protein n=1 Tax=Kitasatospora purpeofusca TaxID=67352 RepID=UPI0036BBBBBE
MAKRPATTTATAPATTPIPNFIRGGDFSDPPASNKDGEKHYMQIDAPEPLGPWRLTDGIALVCSGAMTRSSHQAIDIGGAVLEQEFDTAPVGRTVEITWMHCKNTDRTCSGTTSQSYAASVLDPNGIVVAEGRYVPGINFSPIPATQTLKFPVNSSAPYTLKFEGEAGTSCGAMIYRVVGQAASTS